MSRGRKPSLVPTTQWSIMIPIPLAFQVESQLMDPVTQKATYAARSKLIQSLLYEWLQKQGIKPIVPTDVLCPDCKRPKATTLDEIMTGACPKWFNVLRDDRLNPDYAAAEANCLRHTQADLPLTQETTCGNCNGTGYDLETRGAHPDTVARRQCHVCNGSGKTSRP